MENQSTLCANNAKSAESNNKSNLSWLNNYSVMNNLFYNDKKEYSYKNIFQIKA